MQGWEGRQLQTMQRHTTVARHGCREESSSRHPTPLAQWPICLRVGAGVEPACVAGCVSMQRGLCTGEAECPPVMAADGHCEER